MLHFEIELRAEQADVWRAWTEARELARWFPPRAEVTAGPGGTMVWEWPFGRRLSPRIGTWEPPRLLRLSGAPGSLEVSLRHRRGDTNLSLLHRDLESCPEEEVERIAAAWTYELRGLRLYLERHRGKDRQFAEAGVLTPLAPEAAWDRLLAAGEVAIDAPEPRLGSPFRLRAGGRPFSGRVQTARPRREISGVAEELGDGVVRLFAEREAGQTRVAFWIASYDHPLAVPAARDDLQRLLDRVFAG